MSAFTVLETLTLMKSGGTATLAVRRLSDGSVEFTAANGKKVKVVNPDDVRRLFQALSALDA